VGKAFVARWFSFYNVVTKHDITNCDATSNEGFPGYIIIHIVPLPFYNGQVVAENIKGE